jgi:16S rRNA (cytosine967-C5)-methyltransferase
VRSGAHFDEALDTHLGDLPPLDRGLAHELAAGVLRNRSRLDAALAPLVTAPWMRMGDDTKDLLRLGAWQVIGLDRVPEYAAVNDTVEVAKQTVGTKVSGLVNAVLRRLVREGVSPLPPDADLATRFSHPSWLVARWVAQYGPADTARLLEHNNRAPAVHLRPARWTKEQLLTAFAKADIPFDATNHGFAVRGRRVTDLPGFAEGGFIVQDPAQGSVVAFAAIPEGTLIWDACAAPGGKAAALATGRRVVAGERARARLPRLVGTVRRAAPSVAVLAADATRPPFGLGQFDAVLLDVPCSATGTLAKHPDARWRLEERDIGRLAERQAGLLSGAAETVREGGLLVYITCSLEPEENGMQVNEFLEQDPRFCRTVDDLVVFPPDAGTDGAYAARMERVA